MRDFFWTLIVTCGLATSVQADDALAEMRHGDLIKACIQTLELGQSVDAYARELVSRKRFHLGPENSEKGARCLKAAFGFEYAFEGGRFVSHEEKAEAARRFEEGMREAQVREDERQRREHQYWLATAEACTQMFYKDRFVALTNAACAEVFKVRGLPE